MTQKKYAAIAKPLFFEAKSKKVKRLTAELAALEADRLSKLVVVFGCEFDKLGFYTSVSISTVLFVALIIQLSRSRRKWKRLALTGSPAKQKNDNNTNTTPSVEYVATYTIMLTLGIATFFYYLSFNLGKAFESQQNKYRLTQGIELSNLVLLFGKYQLDKTTFYALMSTAMIFLVSLGIQIGISCRKWKEESQLKKHVDADQNDETATLTTIPTPSRKVLDVVIVGCTPHGYGWFHLMQFLDMSSINVCAVVEPYFMDISKCPLPPQSFMDLVAMLDEMGIRCVYHVDQLDVFKQQTLCVIAGKSKDSPRVFMECIGNGASHIYLEAPGASSVEELKDMQILADTRGVEVFMGYQRVCASFVRDAVKLSSKIPKSHVFFCHNETYLSKQLHLAVTQNPEGLLHSMAIQELAVLVSQFGVKAGDIVGFKVNTNRLFSEKSVFDINGNKLVDLSRVAFKITTNKRRSVSIMADRCGGLTSFAVVKSSKGKELRRFQSHNPSQISSLQSELREDKDIAQKFIIETDEYLELKKRVVSSILSGISPSKSEGLLVRIHDGIEVFILANYCKMQINAVLKVGD